MLVFANSLIESIGPTPFRAQYHLEFTKAYDKLLNNDHRRIEIFHDYFKCCGVDGPGINVNILYCHIPTLLTVSGCFNKIYYWDTMVRLLIIAEWVLCVIVAILGGFFYFLFSSFGSSSKPTPAQHSKTVPLKTNHKMIRSPPLIRPQAQPRNSPPISQLYAIQDNERPMPKTLSTSTAHHPLMDINTQPNKYAS